MKRMLFNATQEEELRVAMVDGQRLYDLNIELPASERKKANIYKGTITRIEPSLEAAFVNYGAERHGFLPLKEISNEYFVAEQKGGGKPNIREVLKEGQDIVVQIDKEERGNKGAALTTYVSLAGRFIVLKPNKARSGGVSRRIVGEDRDLARKSLKEVNIQDGMSVILRTAGIDRSAEELEWDMNNLLAIWEAIKQVVVQRPSPFLIYRESDSVVRALRDYLTNEIGEILIDDEKAFEDAKEFIDQVMPHNLRKLKHYKDPVPLFTRYQIESQIESAFAHQVSLPSGGSMVIDHTEALVSIDINSARATKGGDIEATALNTNLEASDEIARQLRLRDLGGLIVIDYIDMGPQKHQREVEMRLREAVRQDRARVQIGKISRFGLLEMSRQRLRPSLGESSYLTCPRCSGVGNIRSVESLALAILRIIGEEARKERTAKVIAQLPVEVATFLLNEKRDWVQNVESRHETQVVLVANPHLETPHYQVRRVRDDQLDLPENVGTSYELATPDEEQIIPEVVEAPKAELPAVASTVKSPPAPKRKAPEKPKEPGFLSKIVSLFSVDEPEPESSKPARARSQKKKQDSRSRGQRGRRRSESQKSAKDEARKTARKKPAKKRTRKTDDAAEKKQQQRDAADGGKKKAKKKTAKKKPQQREQQQRAAGDEKPAEAKSGRRRSRGGRRRRRSSDSGSAETGAQATSATTETQQPEQQQEREKAPPPERASDRDAPSKDTRAADKSPADAQPKQSDTPRQDARAEDKPPRKKRSKKAKPAADKPVDAPRKEAPFGEQPAKAEQPKKSDAAVKPDASPPAEPQKQESRPADYEDTQPELPVIRMPKEAKSESRPEADKPVEVKSAQLEAKPARKPRKPESRSEKEAEPARAKDSGNGDSRPEKRTDEPKAAPADEKPKGRLLPWEPQATETPPPADSKPDGDRG